MSNKKKSTYEIVNSIVDVEELRFILLDMERLSAKEKGEQYP
jgi:hypothetical protein